MDFKSAAEQQVRETLGWLDDKWPNSPLTLREMWAYNALVSKTAKLLEMTAEVERLNEARYIDKINLDTTEHMLTAAEDQGESLYRQLLEMTAQRDEAQKALEIAKEDIAFMRDAYTGVREFVGSLDTNDDHEDAYQRGAMRKLEEAMGERLTRFLMEKGDQKLFAEAYRELRSRAESAEATIREQAERIKGLQEVIDAAYRGCDCGSDPKSRLIPGHKPTCWKALHLRGKQ